MKKKVIAFLIKFKLTKTDFLNLNIPNLHKNFKAKFIDISKVSSKGRVSNLNLKIKNYYKINNISNLKNLLSDSDYVLDYNNDITNNKKIRNFLNKENSYKFKLIARLGGSQPNFFNFSFIKKIIFLYLFFFNIFKYKKFLFIIIMLENFFKIYFQRSIKKKNFRYYYDYVLVPDDVSERNADNYYINSKKIYVHYADYERHLLSDVNKLYNNNYAVFLDESLFDHPDASILNLRHLLNSRINKSIYYKVLRNFFDNFERATNTKIIIAMHPKSYMSDKDCNKNFNRKIIRNNSYNLIKKSKLVFTHASTSVGYAIILKKPIIFLNSSLMFDIRHFTKILSFSIETGSRIIDINDNYINYNSLFNRDFSLYKNYFNKFVKSSKSKNKYIWDIVGSKLNNI
jgi:hypothetical protein